ncbi:multidrug effflux MFS transporter [Demequina sediminicola]|uniref:multidrug effflux MFS transporter n=1 Tax=Demequina sediminicola TaxID=1095026 RepID=UPI0007867431|nr:multidrug effflux MFS transporter [Demequina sediminicola]
MSAPTQVAPSVDVPVTNPGGITKRRRLAYVLILGALIALGPFTVDLYLPAFPTVAADLQASDAAIQMTLTATMIGFGLGQLIVGPLSDAVGRKRPLLIATSVHVLASLAVVFAPTVEWVMVARVFQGIGAAGGAVVAMAMVRDMFHGQALIRMLANMALVTGVAPVIAPVIGSQLLRVVDWREIFVVLAAYGVLMLLVAKFALHETRPAHMRGKQTMGEVARRYRRLLGDGAFVGIAIVGAMGFTALFSYLSSSSFVLQDQYGVSAQQFGVIFGINAAGQIACTQIASRLMRVLAPRAVAGIGITLMTLGAIALAICSIVDVGLIGVIVPLFFIVPPLGLVMPSVQVMALNGHGAEAGTAASLIGAGNNVVAGAVTPLIGVLGMSALSMATVMIGALLIGAASLWFVVRPRTTSAVIV